MGRMLGGVVTLVEQVAESVLSVVGVRWGTEEPRYVSEPLSSGVEIRRYGPRVAAGTTIEGVGERAARSEGFRRLAGYIFGGNHDDLSIKMTAPVSRQSGEGRKIEMTAPVVQSGPSSGEPDSWVIQFFMPSKWTLETLPAPDDERVVLQEVPSETVAVLRFTGDRSARALTARTERLLQVLDEQKVRTTGETAAWFYDPPWTLPFRRRNEVVVPIRTLTATS